MADTASRDVNRVPTLLGVSNADFDTVVKVAADYTSHRLLVDSLNSSSLIPKAFDYISADYAGATTDVYTYKTGGASGTTVAVLTITWTDATKSVLVSVTRT